MRKTILAATLALTLCAPAFAATNALGLDSTLNMLTFGDFSVPWSDVEGRVAVGGNASISNYSINLITAGAPGAALTVGGNLAFMGGTIHGDVIVGGAYTNNGSGTVTGKVTSGQGFDFATERTRLTQLSSRIDLQANTGSVKDEWGTLVFDASANANGINVFDVNAADVAKNLKLTGLGNSGTVIINVHGNSVDFGSHGYMFFDTARGQVLFNLVDAMQVSAGYVEGSILAPKATFNTGSGVIWGQVVAQSWSGGTQVNNAAFKGELSVAAVPEPQSYAMLLAGLALMAAVARRRNRA